MKKITILLVLIITLSSCRMFSAMDSMIGALEATAETIYESATED